jgi:hypothetical protein
MLMGDVRAEQLIRDIDPAVRSSLSSEQEEAIRAAAGRNPWATHPVDIRVTLPLPFGRFYVTLVAGRDRRSPARRTMDRNMHRLDRFGNLVFMLSCFGALVALSIAFLVLAELI